MYWECFSPHFRSGSGAKKLLVGCSQNFDPTHHPLASKQPVGLANTHHNWADWTLRSCSHPVHTFWVWAGSLHNQVIRAHEFLGYSYSLCELLRSSQAWVCCVSLLVHPANWLRNFFLQHPRVGTVMVTDPHIFPPTDQIRHVTDISVGKTAWVAEYVASVTEMSVSHSFLVRSLWKKLCYKAKIEKN